MPTTPTYAFRYPAGTAPPDVPTDMQNLAVDVEALLKTPGPGQPAVRVYHNAAQSAANASSVVLAFNSERFDQAFGAAAAHHDVTTNNSRLTCLYAGVYQITGTVEWATNVTGQRSVWIRQNGATILGLVQTLPNTTTQVTQQVVALSQLAAADYVELLVYQTSGAGLNVVNAANYSPEFMMVRVG